MDFSPVDHKVPGILKSPRTTSLSLLDKIRLKRKDDLNTPEIQMQAKLTSR